MDARTRAQYTDPVRCRVAQAVGVAPDQLVDLGGFESFVHEAVVEGRPRIVKATWGGRRTPEEMGAELHFVSHVADHGAPVARPLPLASGELLATVASADGAFHVTSWEKAPGRCLRPDELSPDVLQRWGALIGQLHRLATSYPGPPAPCARSTWEAQSAAYAELAREDEVVLAALQLLVERISALPRDAGSFGPMHTDPHQGNIFWHEGRPTLFDFEDMLDFWFVSDMAIVLYYAVMSIQDPDERQARFEAHRRDLWSGYETEHHLPEAMRGALGLFLDLREQELRAVVSRSIDPADRSPDLVRFMEDATRRIRNGQPALGLRV
ncbi:MAG: phosphotransferase enzyme family protein [Planctomycetota bacterium]